MAFVPKLLCVLVVCLLCATIRFDKRPALEKIYGNLQLGA